MIPRPPFSPLFPYTTLFRSHRLAYVSIRLAAYSHVQSQLPGWHAANPRRSRAPRIASPGIRSMRSEEHTSELRHVSISYAVFCLKKNINENECLTMQV